MPPKGDNGNQVDAITAAIEDQAVQDKLFSQLNVVGVGVGRKVTGGVDQKKLCAKVLVSHKVKPREALPERDRVDEKVGGHDTDVVAVGDLFAAYPPDAGTGEGSDAGRGPNEIGPGATAGPQSVWGLSVWGLVDKGQSVYGSSFKQRMRPAEGGLSVGHYRVTAGTIAKAVYDESPCPGIPRKYYILSNNHVLADCNNAQLGDPILQPGPIDGGTLPDDIIARLSRFVPIQFLSPGSPAARNYVDAAVAEGPFGALDREIYWIGYVKRVGENVETGHDMRKSGRTTGYTTGIVIATNATVNVNYPGARMARFVRQIVTTNMSAPGDSGSLVLNSKDEAVGLLFAGSEVATVVNDIHFVQDLLSIKIV